MTSDNFYEMWFTFNHISFKVFVKVRKDEEERRKKKRIKPILILNDFLLFDNLFFCMVEYFVGVLLVIVGKIKIFHLGKERYHTYLETMRFLVFVHFVP